MNAYIFSNALGKVNDKYIMEAITYQKRHTTNGTVNSTVSIEKAADYTATKKVNSTRSSYNRKWVIIAAVVATLMLVGFAFAPKIIEMISGRTIEWDDNHLHSFGTSTNMAEVRDGRVYFTLDNSDITEYCSETTYFRYDFTDEQGISHVILVGGEIDSIGWTEILFLEDGKRLSHSNLITDGNPPTWYVKGNAEVNEDYGYVPPNNDSNYSYESEIEPEVDED